MRLALLFIISCLILPVSFAQSQKSLTNIYSNYLKGNYHIFYGEYLAALDNLEKVKNKDLKSIHVRLKIAAVLIRLEKFDEAEKVLLEAKKIDPESLDVSLSLIFVYSYAQKDQELEFEYEDFLKKAHIMKPKDISISEFLAQFYFYKKRPQEAINVYLKVLEHRQDYVDAYFWLGFLYEKENLQDKAIEIWEQGLKIDANYAPILNSLGYTYAVMGINLERAEEMIKKSLEKEPENGAYLDSLGWIYFKNGDLNKAKEYLEKAAELISDPEIYLHLGELNIEMGEVDKAINYYKEGLLRFPDNKELQLKIKEYEKQN